MVVLSLPCILGFTVLSNVAIGGKGIMDLEDFIISNNILPLGALVYILFCTNNKHGWGWSNFMKETNTGNKGLAFPKWMRIYVKYILPVIILFVWAQSYIAML